MSPHGSAAQEPGEGRAGVRQLQLDGHVGRVGSCHTGSVSRHQVNPGLVAE